MDIGSGAGFPAIPLKIVSGGKYLLLDSLNKRIGFLNMAIQELGLEDIQTLHSRIEDAAHKKEYRHKFDLVLARAVAPLNILVEYALPFLKKGGKLIAYKGKKLFEEIQETTNALKIMGGEIEDKLEYQINGEKRYIISIKSLHEGHEGYPRPLNKPRKRPL